MKNSNRQFKDAIYEQFSRIGKAVSSPKRLELIDLRYHVKQGLWAKRNDKDIVFGFTQPALVLMCRIKDLDELADNGAVIESGDPVVFAIT